MMDCSQDPARSRLSRTPTQPPSTLLACWVRRPSPHPGPRLTLLNSALKEPNAGRVGSGAAHRGVRAASAGFGWTAAGSLLFLCGKRPRQMRTPPSTGAPEARARAGAGPRAPQPPRLAPRPRAGPAAASVPASPPPSPSRAPTSAPPGNRAGGRERSGLACAGCTHPLEDLDEAERLLERVEVDLEGGHPLREGGKRVRTRGGGGGGPALPE
jgi:hypothetical protein